MMGNTGQLVFIPEPPSKKKPVPVVVKVSEVKKTTLIWGMFILVQLFPEKKTGKAHYRNPENL
jgi:hypothetical protein